MPINENYKVSNFLAFNFACFACISIVVFLSSTQPFFINEVIGIEKDEKIGNIIGTLGFYDELSSIISAPLIGTLNDKINNSNFFISGAKLLQATSFLVISFSLLGYGELSSNIFPDLIIFRSIFAIGVTGCMSMVTVKLNELSSSDFTFRRFFFWKSADENIPLVNEPQNKNGKYSAFVGISTGLGAIFAVSFFLTLPVRLVDIYPNLSIRSGLKLSYVIIGLLAILVGILLVLFLYDPKPEQRQNEEKIPYLVLLVKGIKLSRNNRKIQLAYLGSFVARSTTVTTSVFIPLLVYNYYYKSGKCVSNPSASEAPSKKNCHEGYIFAAILTGIAQTIALSSAPLWGWLIDSKYGTYRTMLIASTAGLVGNFGICASSLSSPLYDPRSPSCFTMVSLIGLSQIGIIITGMSLLTSLNKDLHIGSLSGLYSLSGGLGILLISKVGGYWSDYWILGPFFLLGLFNLILMLSTFFSLHHETNLATDD